MTAGSPSPAAAWSVYSRLFAATGLDDASVRSYANGCLDALVGWAPDLADEVRRSARDAGLPVWQLAALNARTEVLARGGAARAGECSTVVDVSGASPVGAQTWDWHRELAGSWRVRHHDGGGLPFVTLTEDGVLAKIGMNGAGVAVLLNILGHASDGAGPAVPVHAVARRVLDTAGSVEEALGIIRSAPVAASSCLTVLDADTAVAAELSPAGVAVIEPVDGRLVHTNHFVDPALAFGDVRGPAEPDTYERYDVLRARSLDGSSTPLGTGDLVALLDVHGEDGAEVCCHAGADAPFGEGWQTLATVTVDAGARRFSVRPGGPCSVSDEGWVSSVV